ncbi:MAG TPA: NAD(P)/FAD-dependent oxidoreductase [Chloroflexota bacterium]
MRVAVLGAGFAGLTAAHLLAKGGHEVVVFEAAAQPGGLASGFRDERWEWPLERFYHHLFTTDWSIRRLVDEIGYGEKLVFRRQVTAQWWEGRARPLQGGLESVGLPFGPRLPVPDIVSTGLSVVSFPGLPFLDRVRMGIVSAYLKYGVRDWRPLERATAADWTRRWMGETVYRAFVLPLLEGKFGPYAGEVNMSWLWARLKARSFRLGYFDGGFQGFAEALTAFVRGEGVRVELGRPVSALSQLPGGEWRIVSAPGLDAAITEAYDADAVIATGSPGLLSKLAPQLPPTYLEQIRKLRSLGAVVMTIALRRQLLPGVYWLNMPKDEFPFLALVEHTNFVGTRPYGGDHLVYCGDYLDPSHEYFKLSQEELLGRFMPALKAVNPAFEPSWIRETWLHREPYAQPIVPVNHSRNVPPLSTPLPGLFWASMSQVYPWDRGTNYAVEIGERVAGEVAAYARAAGR